MLVYFKYKVSWWVEHSEAKGWESTPILAEGLCAYAEGQAQLQWDLASSFRKKWASLLGGEGTEEVIAAVEVESNDELDGAGAGSEEEAMAEADEEDEGMAGEEFTRDN
jgi:hypothetical protein